MSATALRPTMEPQFTTRLRSFNLRLPSFQYDARLAKLYSLSLLISIAYLLFGYDTGTIGSLTTTPQFQAYFGELREIVKGAVVASLLLASALTGLVAGRISDRISRKYTVAIGATIFAAGSAICCAAPNLAALITGRVIAGLGEGLFLSPANTYIVEIAPKDVRGRMAAIPQIYTNIGISLGFFICYGTVKIPSEAAFRIPISIQIFFALCLAIGAPFVPHSPRWLVIQGRLAEARQVLDKLMPSSAEAEKEEALAVRPQTSQSGNIFQKAALPSTLWGCWLQAAQQLTGIDFVLFYAPLLFAQAGLDPESSAFIASAVTGLVLLGTTCAFTPFMDRMSRKKAMVGGGAGIGGSLILIGLLYATNANQTVAGQYTIIVFVEVYAVCFASTWGMYTRLYTTEQYLPSVRAAASSFSLSVNQLLNCMVALTAPAFLAASDVGPYFLYGSWTAFTGLLCLFMMSETRGRSLESIGLSDTAQPHKQFLKAFKRRLRSQEPPTALHPLGSATSHRYPPSAAGADIQVERRTVPSEAETTTSPTVAVASGVDPQPRPPTVRQETGPDLEYVEDDKIVTGSEIYQPHI